MRGSPDLSRILSIYDDLLQIEAVAKSLDLHLSNSDEVVESLKSLN